MIERLRIPIEGMTCPSCVGHITGAVRKLNGFESVRVDLASDSATVAFDRVRVSLATIGEAIDRAGYSARLDAAEPAPASRSGGLLARLGPRWR